MIVSRAKGEGSTGMLGDGGRGGCQYLGEISEYVGEMVQVCLLVPCR